MEKYINAGLFLVYFYDQFISQTEGYMQNLMNALHSNFNYILVQGSETECKCTNYSMVHSLSQTTTDVCMGEYLHGTHTL